MEIIDFNGDIRFIYLVYFLVEMKIKKMISQLLTQ